MLLPRERRVKAEGGLGASLMAEISVQICHSIAREQLKFRFPGSRVGFRHDS